jgi:hypothetical protein
MVFFVIPHISYGSTSHYWQIYFINVKERIPQRKSASVISIPQIASLDIEVTGGKQQWLREERQAHPHLTTVPTLSTRMSH